jgi:hypothetical protein
MIFDGIFAKAQNKHINARDECGAAASYVMARHKVAVRLRLKAKQNQSQHWPSVKLVSSETKMLFMNNSKSKN